MTLFNRRFVSAMVVVLLLGCGTAAMGQATVDKFSSKGAEGDILGGCNSEGYCVQFFAAIQTETGVVLSFFISTPQGNFVSGFGVVPSSSLTVTSNQLVLAVDTSNIADYRNEICAFEGEGTLVCNPANGGTLNFTFTKLNGSTSTFSGTQTFSGRGFTLVFSGTRISTSASAVGNFSVSGYAATFGAGQLTQVSIAKNRNVSITVTR